MRSSVDPIENPSTCQMGADPFMRQHKAVRNGIERPREEETGAFRG